MSPPTLLDATGLRPGQLAAAVGGGGKTSLLNALAREAAGAGLRPVVLTTTTKIFAPEEADSPLLLGDGPALRAALGQLPAGEAGVLTLARRRLEMAPVPGDPSRRRMKLDGLPPEEVTALRGEGGAVLVEADGSRGLPIKAPGPDEPVVPADADLVLGVVGLDALDAPIDEAHTFRPALLAHLTGQTSGSPVTAETLGRLAAHPEGLFRGAPPRARRLVVLNKADSRENLEILEKIAYIIMELAGPPDGPVQGVICTACTFPRAKVFLQMPENR